MTEERIYEILRENGYDELSPDGELMTSIKQIVNEAIQECADQTIGSEQLLVRRRILKLKVK